MKVVIQRVTQASVKVNQATVGEIEAGLLVLVGITHLDAVEDVAWLSKKIVNLRIFNDETGKMNRSLLEIEGNILLVSQFTLQASTKKGNRPAYIEAAPPKVAIPLYERLIEALENQLGRPIATGAFGEDMQVSLCNDGPVTIVIDIKNKI
ncbi:MAG: D-aminoacyl-tRNA deacylase [Thermonemataceae bacterium]